MAKNRVSPAPTSAASASAAPAGTRACKRCLTPYTSASRSCVPCAEFTTLARTAKSDRTATTYEDGRTAPGISMDRVQFAAWYADQSACCAYCSISVADLPLAGFLTQTRKPLHNMGIDRLDNSKPYEVGNIVRCCLACNQVKSNRYTSQEMFEFFAPALRLAHEARVRAARAKLRADEQPASD